jgi:hypothetical protein
MTVMARNNEPGGTFTEGYDQGLKDATEGAPRKYKTPTLRQRNAGFYRHGYSEGYTDGVFRSRCQTFEHNGSRRGAMIQCAEKATRTVDGAPVCDYHGAGR